MSDKWRMAGYILKAYSGSRWTVRTFVLIRYLVCPWQHLVDLIKDRFGSGALLDIGCGHGLLLHLVQMANKGRICVGVDHDPGKVSIARKSFANNPFTTVLDSFQPRQPTQKFDGIVLIDVLYNIAPEQWSQIWHLIHRQLKPGGIVLIKETVNHPKLKYWVCLLQEILATRIFKYTRGDFPFLPAATYYLDELHRNGFEVIEHRRIDQGYLWPHYLFLARPHVST